MVSVIRVNASSVLSGDHDASFSNKSSALATRLLLPPVRAMISRKLVLPPGPSRVNAINLPFGDQSGSLKDVRSRASVRIPFPFARTKFTEPFDERANAILSLFGDHAGCMSLKRREVSTCRCRPFTPTVSRRQASPSKR